MSAAVQDWTPPGWIAPPAIRARIEDAVAAWSRRWFVDRPIKVSTFELSSRTPPRSGSWVFHRAELALNLSPGAWGRLFGWLMNAAPQETIGTPVDQALSAALEARLLGDLVSGIENGLNIAGDAPRPPRVSRVALGFSRGIEIVLSADEFGDLIFLAVPLPVLARASRSFAGAAGRTRLASLEQALGPTPVRIEALLGRAAITLEEFNGLAVGDVLVLDTPISDGVDLSVAASGHSLARGRLSQGEDRLAVSLIAPSQ